MGKKKSVNKKIRKIIPDKKEKSIMPKKEEISLPAPCEENKPSTDVSDFNSLKKLNEFKDCRKKCQIHIKSEMFQDLKDVKNLDDRILKFIDVAKSDLKRYNHKDVKNVVKQFEDEIYAELNSIISNAKEDFDLLKDILNALNKLKKEIDFKDESLKLVGLEQYEIKYAESVIQTGKNRLDEIKKTFDELKKQ